MAASREASSPTGEVTAPSAPAGGWKPITL